MTPTEGDVVTRLRTAGCVFAEDEARMLRAAADGDCRRLTAMVERRAGGAPLELVVGFAQFCGLRLTVARGVFVPRRRSEFLARCALGVTRRAGCTGRRAVAVELCCGVAPVAAVLAPGTTGVEIHAVDIDPVAVACARTNLAGTRAEVHQGDLDASLPAELAGRVDVLVANAPYVPTAEHALLPAEAREYEHRAALDGGADGLQTVRRVVAAAPRWLDSRGCLLVECAERQAAAVIATMAAAGLAARAVTDARSAATVALATRRPGPARALIPESV